MADSYSGLPANIINSLPAPIGISSSTNATPIVVHTSAAHLLEEGDALVITDHLVNTNANGRWIAHIIDGDHVALHFMGGTNSVGNGAGVNTGQVQSAVFGPRGTIPEDGDAENAASVNLDFESLADQTAAMWLLIGWMQTIQSGGFLSINNEASLSLLVGSRFVRPAPQRPVDAATITVGVHNGDVVHVADSGGVARTVKLQTTTAPVPVNGQRMIVDATNPALTAANWTVQREDGTVLIEVHEGSWAEFQFESGVWRGVRFAGTCTAHAAWSP